jgi:flagellin
MATPLAIVTNIGAITAQKNLRGSLTSQRKSIQRLSSGLRVNSAADDAAGMAVATGLRAQLKGYSQASRNANDAIAILQTAEGAYQNLSDILIRMRELSVQAANDSLTDKERAYLNTEFSALKDEIDRVSAVTEYNGQHLLDGTAGSAGTMTFQIGTRNTTNDRITILMPSQDATSLNLAAVNVSSLALAQSAITSIDASLDLLAVDRAQLGATLNKISNARTNLGITIENVNDAVSIIRDADIASESAAFASSQVLQQSAISMLASANQIPSLAMRLLQ